MPASRMPLAMASLPRRSTRLPGASCSSVFESGKTFVSGWVEDCVSPRVLHIGFGGKVAKADEVLETESVIKRVSDIGSLARFG